MIRMIRGSTLINGKTYSSKSGAFSAPDELENNLVSKGVAVFVLEPVATAIEDTSVYEYEEDIIEEEEGSEDNEYLIPEYDFSTSMQNLRQIAKEHGLTVKVGVKKADLISELDELFGLVRTEDIEGPIV